jgi:hypothetical protein
MTDIDEADMKLAGHAPIGMRIRLVEGFQRSMTGTIVGFDHGFRVRSMIARLDGVDVRWYVNPLPGSTGGPLRSGIWEPLDE